MEIKYQININRSVLFARTKTVYRTSNQIETNITITLNIEFLINSKI